MRHDGELAGYIASLIETCAQTPGSLVSVVLFGSAAKGGFSGAVSDVDVIVVLSDGATRAHRRHMGDDVARLETLHELRPATIHGPGRVRARIERAVGHGMSCFVCTRSDLISGDVARVLDLKPWEAPFVDRIVFASIITSAKTVWGEDLLSQVPVPAVRRADVVKAFCGFSNQIVLSAIVFPVLADATRYAMGALKHSLHSCFFCYHQRTTTLDEEVEFFNRRLGTNRTLMELLSLRRQYRPSFGFVLRCLPTLARLHLRTARDNRFPRRVTAHTAHTESRR